MNCCTPSGYRTIFGTKTVERDARRYRAKGLTGSAGWLLHALTDDGINDRSILEVGGGIGSLQIELLEAGAGHTTNVEIIDSYEATARALIDEHGWESRVERQIADYAQHPDQASAADIVIMHRVICCYPDPDTLTAAACARARDRVAITIPRQAWWVRIGFSGMNSWLRLRRIAFRGYVHPHAQILEVATTHGFHTTHHQRGWLWESLILQHTAAERERAGIPDSLAPSTALDGLTVL
jgi:magnesium-protoporphyrin O-methyltransferase